MEKKLKAALLGCGGMGMSHNLSLKALEEEMKVEVIAIADCRKEFLEKGAAVWPDARAYETGMELLEKEKPDFVHICLPSYLHTDHAVVAMAKGCHVFVEKPVCLTKEEGRRLLAAQKETGVKAMVGQVLRSFPEYRYLKKVYEDGSLGKLKSLVMQRISARVDWGFENWFQEEEKSGGVVMDLHIHDLDFLRYMLGEPDSFEVKATAYETGMINHVAVAYEYGQAFVTEEAIWDESPSLEFAPSFRAGFEEGTVSFDGTKTPSLTLFRKEGGKEYPKLEGKELRDTSMGINISDLGPYYLEIRYFIECLRENREIGRAPLEEGVKSALLAREELEAARKYVDGKAGRGLHKKKERVEGMDDGRHCV